MRSVGTMEGKLDLLHDEIAETLPPPKLRDFVQVEANNAEKIVADSLAKLRQLIDQTIEDTESTRLNPLEPEKNFMPSQFVTYLTSLEYSNKLMLP